LIRSPHWKKVLAAAGVMQAIMLSSNYLSIFGGYTIDVDWFFGNLVFFFVFGIVLHFHYDEIKAWVHRTRIFWLAALAVCTVLAIVETEVYFRLGLGDWRGGVETAAASLYIICFLMLFIEFDKIEFRYSNWLGKIGQKSYGIYLTHPITLMLASKLIYHLAPAVLAYQWLFTPLLILLGAAVPLLMMRIVSQTPLRKGYRFLFG
jgi:peptidoglycan/LPS O-acetylase OafA/YrhL